MNKGDRILTKINLEAGTVVEYLGEFDYPKVRVLMDGETEPVVYYEDSLIMVAPEKELERILVLAENSESMDAIRLAAEVRRLRKIESGLKNLIEARKEILRHVRAQIVVERDNGYFYGTNGVIELKEKVIQLRTEISIAEELLED